MDQQFSSLAQVGRMTAEHSLAAWSEALDQSITSDGSASELATILLAANYELLGYSPAQAWMFARRGESSAPGSLDG